MRNKSSVLLRKILYSFLIVGLIWAAFNLGDVPQAYAQGSAPAQALVKLSIDKKSFGAQEDVILHVKINNPNAEAIQVLEWLLPPDGLEEALFTVTRDGQPVDYVGPIYKRVPPTEKDYLSLQPGETRSSDIILSAYYDFSVSGTYAVTYDINSPQMYATEQQKGLLQMSGHLTSNEVRLVAEGRAMPKLNAITVDAVSGPTGFVSCSASQQSDLLTARTNAAGYAGNALVFLNSNQTGIRYTTWFGVYDATRYSTVRTHYTNINNAMNNATVNFSCTCATPGMYAYVYNNQPYNIYLCPAFWSAPATGTDSKAGTLVHETSHFLVVAGTQDFVYGQSGAQSLAISDPAKAITNADNHEYFAENNPPLVDQDAYEPDDTSAQAKPIAVGTTSLAHSIQPASDVDWFKFVLNTPSAVVLETTGAAGGDTVMGLYDGTGTNQFRSNDDKPGSPAGYYYSYINTCDVTNLAAGTYYVKVTGFNNAEAVPSYNLSVSAGSNCVYTDLAGALTGMFPLYPGASSRQSYIGKNNGPVKLYNVDGNPIVGAERVIYKVNNVATSFSEMMGLPNSQLSTTYWFPWYDNVGTDTQLRFGNVSGNQATVHLVINGVEKTSGCTPSSSPYTLSAGASLRVSCTGVTSGMVQLWSDQSIVAAERVIYQANGVNTSFTEMMGLPNGGIDSTQWLPWYNNVDLDTQLRIGNVSFNVGTFHVYIGGSEMPGSPFTIPPLGTVLKSYPGVNSGPVQIVRDNADGFTVASERVIYNVNGVNTSYTEMIGLPGSKLNTTYYLPWYNNVDLDTQLRFGNVSNNTATVHVYIGGSEMPNSPFTLNVGQSTRLSFAGVNNGPVRIQSNVNIVAAERVIYKVNGVQTSFTEMMGLPAPQLNTTYWLPWYNNVDLDTQLRFGLP